MYLFILMFIVSNLNPVFLNTYDSLNCTTGFASNGHTCDACGISYVQRNARFYGGLQAASKSWPSNVLIYQTYTTQLTLVNGSTIILQLDIGVCSGTLVNSYTIVTAAECLASSVNYTVNGQTYTIQITKNSYHLTWGSMFYVVLGPTGFANTISDVSASSVIMDVEAVKIHLSYNPSNNTNNIALLLLTNEATYSQAIQPACLPSQLNNYPPVNTSVIATGWSDGANNYYTYLLNSKMVATDTYAFRTGNYPKLEISDPAGNDQIGGCPNDKGSGAYTVEVINGIEKHVLVGIMNSENDSCTNSLPTICTRVSYYVDWIRNNWKVVGAC